MHINGTSPLPMSTDMCSAETVTAAATTSSGIMSTLSSAIAAVGIDSTTLSSFMGTAGMAKDGVFALTNAYASVKSFGQWMSGGPTMTGASLTTVAHGMNAMALLDKVGGNVVGLASYTGLAGSFVNATKVVHGLQEGDMSKVVFSGAKLCATLALTGNPVAGVAIATAEQVYNRYVRQ